MIILSLIWAVLIFFILLIFSLGSYCFLLRSSNGQQSRDGRSNTILSLCNCFACGIFLSTCFLGLVPHIREHENKLRILWATDSGIDTAETTRFFMRTELIVLIGFLLILFAEQVFNACGRRSSSSRGHTCRSAPTGRKSSAIGTKEGDDAIGTTATALLSIGGDEEPLVLDRFDSEDSEGDGANSAPTIEFRRIDDGHDEHHGPTGHSGHSHLNVLSASGNKLTFSSCLLLLGLSTHSLFEGIALGVQTEMNEFYGLLLAIMLHEVLCSLAFGVNLAQQRTPIGISFIAVLILAACIPIGMCSSILVNSLDSSSSLFLRFVLEGLAAGTFIYVACVEMLNAELHSSNSEHTTSRSGIYKAISVIAGVVIFFAITVRFGGHTIRSATTTASPTLQSPIRALH